MCRPANSGRHGRRAKVAWAGSATSGGSRMIHVGRESNRLLGRRPMATTAPTTTRQDQPETPLLQPLPLENGDHLTRAEFERRYEAMPNVKAELIEGVVFMASPVRHHKHG